MKGKLKLLFLKLWPKLLVVLIGVGVYLLAVSYLENDLKSLFVGISSSLISIPFIFIFYEIWQDKTHRKLNESVYDFALNQMTVNVGSIKRKLEVFTQGAFFYFDRPGYIIDDSDVENVYIKKPNNEVFLEMDDDWDDDILSFELSNVFDSVVDVRYLGYQLGDLSIEDESKELQELLANSFIMERVDDDKTRVIIRLVKSLQMLHSFLSLHHDVFVRSSIEIHGFQVNNLPSGLAELTFSYPGDPDPELLDMNIADPQLSLENLLAVYVVNPDYYSLFSDHINDVLEAIRKWRLSADATYVDYEVGSIASL